MRRSPTLIILALILALSLLVSARPVFAAPAQPYAVASCDTRTDSTSGDVTEFCSANKGVTQTTVLPSGDVKYTDNRTVTFTTRVNGVVTFSETVSVHTMEMFRAGGYQAFSRVTEAQSFVDPVTGELVTCTISNTYVLANGEVRHEASSYDCSM